MWDESDTDMLVAMPLPLTDQAKRKILGENLLRLHGMDVEQAKAAPGRRQR